MSVKKRTLAVIPARAGSKRLPGKNYRALGGKPLIQWTIEAARSVEMIDTVCVSTDDRNIRDLAIMLGVEAPFIRPDELASDTASSIDVVCHAMDWYRKERGVVYDFVMLLQPTSPFRTADHIREALELREQRGANAVISVCPVSHSPLWCNTLPDDGDMDGFLKKEVIGARSQDLPKYYRLNGAIYIARSGCLSRKKSFLISDRCFSYRMLEVESLDIDTELDWLFGEAVLKYYSIGGVPSGL